MPGEVCDLDPRKDHRSSQQSSRKRLNNCWPWIVTNDVRYRGASLRSGLWIRHEGKLSARASNGTAGYAGTLVVEQMSAMAGPPQGTRLILLARMVAAI
jgi:hypothetical protein